MFPLVRMFPLALMHTSFLFFFYFFCHTHFIFPSLIQASFFIIIISIIIVIIIFMLYLSTLLVTGGEFIELIRAAWSTPTNWLFWGNCRVSIKLSLLLLLLFHKLYLGDHCRRVDVHFYIYHMASFNYNSKEARDVDLSCWCHLSDSRIVSSRESNLLLWLCVNLFICCCCCCYCCC